MIPNRLYSTGRRLTRTCWTGDEHHSIRIGYRFHQLALGARLDAEGAQIEREVALVENSENDLLAEQRREGRDTEIDDLGADFELDATVLRDTTLGDVQACHDLEAGD